MKSMNRGCRGIEILQLVIQSHNHEVARIRAKRRRFLPMRIDVAVTGRAVREPFVPHRQIDLEDAVMASQILWLAHDSANIWARTLTHQRPDWKDAG